MKPAPFAYHRPTSVSEVFDLLERHGGAARLLAGGQSLMPMLNGRELRPSAVVDLNGVESLEGMSDVGDRLRVGALVRQHEVAAIPGVELLGQAVAHVGHLHTRHRGTVCGSLAHRDPLAELPLALLVAGGSVEVAGNSGAREVTAEEFLSAGVGPAEMILAAWWPRSAGPVAFEEITQGGTVCAAAAVIDADESVRVGVAGTVQRPRLAVGSAVDELMAELARHEFIDDDIAPADYRAAASLELARRCVDRVVDEVTS